MSTQPEPQPHIDTGMKRYLHEARREEVLARYFDLLLPSGIAGSASASRWHDIYRNIFNAAYDYYNPCGTQVSADFVGEQRVALHEMMNEGLVDSLDQAEAALEVMVSAARKATQEVHATDYDRARFRDISKPPHMSRVDRRPILTLKKGAETFNGPDQTMQIRAFFTQRSAPFWEKYEPQRMVDAAMAHAPITAHDIDIYMYRTHSHCRYAVTHVPAVRSDSASMDSVKLYLSEQLLNTAATQAWVLRQFEDRFIDVVQQTAQRNGFTPGNLKGGQWAVLQGAVQEQMIKFRHDLSDHTEIMMGNHDAQATQIDLVQLEQVMTRSLKEYLSKGPSENRQR